MLASTLNVIDPLLSSPGRVTRHNDDMAAIQEPPNLELTPSAFASLSSTSTSSSLGVSAHSHPNNNPTNDNDNVDDASSVESKVETDNDGEDQDQEEDPDPFEEMMNRGNYLRQLRLMALADEQERLAEAQAESLATTSLNCFQGESEEEEKKECTTNESSTSNNKKTSTPAIMPLQEDKVTIHPHTKERILDFHSYLAHQRYYDDLKHVDIHYMDYGTIVNPHYKREQHCGNLIIQQTKSLGKGGFCWDAAYCLAEFVIRNEELWNPNYHHYYYDDGEDEEDSSGMDKNMRKTNVLELGSGTGLCGLMIGKATNSHVLLTDLPELLDLMEGNVKRNYYPEKDDDHDNADDDNDSNIGKNNERETRRDELITTTSQNAKGTTSAHVLRWGTPEDYTIAPSNDLIIGADIVASLYDPIALARTIYDLSGPSTKIYISSKSRLDKPHEEFWGEMERLFERVEKVMNKRGDGDDDDDDDDDDDGSGGDNGWWSKLRNPNVFFIVAEGKKKGVV